MLLMEMRCALIGEGYVNHEIYNEKFWRFSIKQRVKQSAICAGQPQSSIRCIVQFPGKAMQDLNVLRILIIFQQLTKLRREKMFECPL
jgi:hypothetical protein